MVKRVSLQLQRTFLMGTDVNLFTFTVKNPFQLVKLTVYMKVIV